MPSWIAVEVGCQSLAVAKTSQPCVEKTDRQHPVRPSWIPTVRSRTSRGSTGCLGECSESSGVPSLLVLNNRTDVQCRQLNPPWEVAEKDVLNQLLTIFSEKTRKSPKSAGFMEIIPHGDPRSSDPMEVGRVADEVGQATHSAGYQRRRYHIRQIGKPTSSQCASRQERARYGLSCFQKDQLPARL